MGIFDGQVARIDYLTLTVGIRRSLSDYPRIINQIVAGGNSTV